MKIDLSEIRKDYSGIPLGESDFDNIEHPVDFIEKWVKQAVSSACHEPNAMTLSTVNEKNQPRSRVVLLKKIIDYHLYFFTNYKSSKVQDILKRPQVCLNFFWPELARQIRIEGKASLADADVSDEYFNSRPYLSRLGAWASPQSETLKSRDELETMFQDMRKQYSAFDHIPRPSWWGGIKVNIEYCEFWQGRESRLHDRILLSKGPNSHWDISRLAP